MVVLGLAHLINAKHQAVSYIPNYHSNVEAMVQELL
jgi:hypothetical protein